MDDENELENQSIDIPIWKRYLLTVTEAAQFYHVGEKRLRQIVKERIEGGANEKAVLRLFINCPFVCINFDFFWLNKARQLYMDF